LLGLQFFELRHMRSVAEELQRLEQEARACQKCRLSQGRTQAVFGVGSPTARLMFIGEAPGFYEDKQGEPFVGAAGKLLDKAIHEALKLTRADVYITNVVKCRPPNNRDPQPDEIEACAPFLASQLELIAPEIICTLGNFATRAILGSAVNISRVRGKKIERDWRIVVPTYHPAAILRNANLFDQFKEDIFFVKRLLEEGARRAEAKPEQPSLFDF
jgi:DNA polymerase